MDHTQFIPISQAKEVSDIFKHISNYVSRNRIRLKEPFQDFDRLRSNHVTRNQFLQCLKQLRIELNASQMDTIADRYVSERSTPTLQLINYANFVKEIEFGIDNIELEKKPTREPVSTKEEDDFYVRRRRNEADNEEDRQVRILLERLKHTAKQRGVIIKDLFVDFDRVHHGTVTKAQFLQSLPFKEFRFEELQLLVKRYENQEGLVDYLVFHHEVMGDEEIGQLKFEGEQTYCTLAPKGTEKHLFHYDLGRTATLKTLPKEKLAEETEKMLKELVARHRVKIDENLRDFDPLRKGTITVAQFQSCIGAIKFPKYSFSQAELDALTAKYAHVDAYGKESVHYTDLLDNIFRVFTGKDVEKTPTAQVKPLIETLHQSSGFRCKSKCADARFEALLEKIRHIVKTRRIYLKDIFIDFDRTCKDTNSTHITPTRFERALLTIGLKFSPEELKLLCQRYNDQDDGDVNYRAFLEDVDWEDQPF